MSLDPSLIVGVGLGVAVVETLRWALAPKSLPADLRSLIAARARAEAKAECDAQLVVLGRRLREAEGAIARIAEFESAVGELVATATGGIPGATLDLDLDEPMNFDPREN